MIMRGMTDRIKKSPRWALNKLDKDAMMAAAVVIAWPEDQIGCSEDVRDNRGADCFRNGMTAICYAGMQPAACQTV